MSVKNVVTQECVQFAPENECIRISDSATHPSVENSTLFFLTPSLSWTSDQVFKWILNTKEAGVIYRSKFLSSCIALKFWGGAHTYIGRLYTKFQLNRSEGTSQAVEVKFWLFLLCISLIFGYFQVPISGTSSRARELWSMAN